VHAVSRILHNAIDLLPPSAPSAIASAGPRTRRRSRGRSKGSVKTIPARCLELLSCRAGEGKTHFCSPCGELNGEPFPAAAARARARAR